ncbi:MAG: hypothetical protein Q9183_001279 [Haloplaca sp. 2 TL-2023]
MPQDAASLSHRSHDPSSNLKRSDPFQFGSRYLLPEDNPFEFNAWDHVEPSEEDLQRFESQIEAQRTAPVSDFDRNRFNADPAKWWNRFYTNNNVNFFKDRKWLAQEFPVLDDVTKKDVGTKVILEIGAGAGNTCFPILRANENDDLKVWACDFSEKAVQLVRSAEAYDERFLRAEVWDVSSSDVPRPPGLEEESVDVVLMVFVFSALHPTQWRQAVDNIWTLLKPGGEVCFRDYGRGDLAQVRMKKGRWMEENFYIRGDGTRVYFFGEDELRGIWSGRLFQGKETSISSYVEDGMKDESAVERDNYEVDSHRSVDHTSGAPQESRKADPWRVQFEISSLGVDRRLLINRHKQLKMYRCWMQGRFRKA